MSILVCVSCGGNLFEVETTETFECDSCGVRQTAPKIKDDTLLHQYNRGMEYLRSRNYDDAKNIFEKLLDDDANDAQLYWALVMCQYGVEYVEDPKTLKRHITLNRTQYTSIFDNPDFKLAFQNSDSNQRMLFTEEANTIEEIQARTIKISQTEDPFDIFISYKDSDDTTGERTEDSYRASDLYDILTGAGYKVFYSRITLQSNAGKEYEPYIFSALNSAKVMIVVAGSLEHVNATWLKNEWSRYLSIMAEDTLKEKQMIPVYFNIEPEELLREMAKLQALNMNNKISFNAVLRENINTILKKNQEPIAPTIVERSIHKDNQALADNQYFRGDNSLRVGNFSEALEFFENALNYDAREVKYYWATYLAKNQTTSTEELLSQDGVANVYNHLYFNELGLEVDRILPIFNAQHEISTILSYVDEGSELRENINALFDKLKDIHVERQKVHANHSIVYNTMDEEETILVEEKNSLVSRITTIEDNIAADNQKISNISNVIEDVNLNESYGNLFKTKIIAILLWPIICVRAIFWSKGFILALVVGLLILGLMPNIYIPGLIVSVIYYAVRLLKPANERKKQLKDLSIYEEHLHDFESSKRNSHTKLDELASTLEDVTAKIDNLNQERANTLGDIIKPLNGVKLYR